MATATAYRSVDMFDAQVWYGNVTAATQSHIQITSGGYVQNYYGNFTYNTYTVSGGTISSSNYYEYGSKVYEITGGSFSAVTVANYLYSGNMQGVLSYIFSGSDTFNGSLYSDALNGFAGNDSLYGNGGDDFLKGDGGNDTLVGGGGVDTAVYSGYLSNYTVAKSDNGYTLTNTYGADGIDTLTSVERLQFADKTVNLTIQGVAAGAADAAVTRLAELYVAFFNRVPDADGLEYWINQYQGGWSIDQIAEAFYSAGVQYSNLTGFSATMSAEDFVNVVYRNVLGRADGADSEGLNYWSTALRSGTETHGSLVSTILDSAHSFKGDATWGWVPDLLDNKIDVARTFAIDLGLNYNTPADNIAQGMAIAAAITPNDTAAALALIGVHVQQIDLG